MGLASERTLTVPKGEGRKQDGLGGISTLNIASKQLNAIISLKDMARCRVDAQQYGNTHPVSRAYLICVSPPHAFLKVNCRYSRIFFSAHLIFLILGAANFSEHLLNHQYLS